MNDDLGDRMKMLEGAEADRRLMPLLPALARIDGRAFHPFTRGMRRPYDERLSRLMITTCRQLVAVTNACMGYTQSDEITLAWLAPDHKSEIFFGGRIMKMTSQLAALASVYFNNQFNFHFPEGYEFNTDPTFDARVWNVPTVEEGANVFLWRELDATRNSVQMASQAKYSHKQLDGKNTVEMMNMLHAAGVNWNDYPAFFRRGTYVQKRTIRRKFTEGELDKLPEKHEARGNPNLVVERNVIMDVDVPPLSKVINRAEFIFCGQDPRTCPEQQPAEPS